LTTAARVEAALASFPLPTIGLIAVEAGTQTHIVRKLRALRYPVAIFEARKASKFLAIRRSKTDSGDARGLADLARLGPHTVSQVYLKSPECQHLRSCLALRQKLVTVRVTIRAVIFSMLALHGRHVRRRRTSRLYRNEVMEQLAALKAEDNVDLAVNLMPLVDMCDLLWTYLDELDCELERKARAHPVCRLLMEVPGVGPICALSFYSAIEDPTRFGRSSDVAAYLGLVPRRYQSGNVTRTLGITKNGCKRTRSNLVTAATVFRMRAPDSSLKEWALILKDRIGSRRSKVALARKLAILLLTMWKNGSQFEHFPRAQRTTPLSQAE
jgi:transposase